MRAIVEINGKQYEVEEGRYVQIDHYAAQENQEVTLGNVTMILAGEHSLIGAPYVEGATVKTRVKRHGRGPKVLVYKMRCKKGYRRKNGHRQGFTELLVDVLDFPGKDTIAPLVKTEAPTEKPKAPKTKKAESAPKTKAAVVEQPTEEKPKKKAASTAKPTQKADATEEAAPKKATTKKSTPKAPEAEVAQPAVEEASKAPEAVQSLPEEAPKAEAAPAVEEVQTTGEGPSETVE